MTRKVRPSSRPCSRRSRRTTARVDAAACGSSSAPAVSGRWLRMIRPTGTTHEAEREHQPPAPVRHRLVADRERQDGRDDAGEQGGAALAGDLPARHEAALLRRRRLQEVGGGRADLAAEREALDETARDDDHLRPAADRRVGGAGGQHQHAERHQRDGDQHRGLAPGPVREGADQHAADGPHDVADAEQGQRGQQAVGRVVGGEERLADGLGEEGVDREVVEFEGVAEHHGAHRLAVQGRVRCRGEAGSGQRVHQCPGPTGCLAMPPVTGAAPPATASS